MLRVALGLTLAGVAVVVVSAGVARGANPQPADDLTALQGYWKPLQCEFQGVAQMTADEMTQITAVYDKSEYHLYFKEKEGDKGGKPRVYRVALANVELDPTTSPKSITFVVADGPFKGQRRHGIYELAGNQLRLCYGPSERPKPTEFKSPASSGYFLETWARQVK
jgi:uncharacterized protein (TIGR03067 family)